MSRLHVRPGVDDDIFELAEHLIDRSEEIARRFVDAAQKTLKDIVRSPGLGGPKDFGDDPALQGIRSWRVEGFPNHLVFYRLVPDGVEVLAVFHGARDIVTWLRRRVR
jgi:toxin ParE1/3/4